MAAGREGGRRLPHVHTPYLPLLLVAAYGINSILYQRGIYPPETFTRVQKYGLTLLITTDPELKNYLNNVVEQMKGGGGLGWAGELRGVLQAAKLVLLAEGCQALLDVFLPVLIFCTLQVTAVYSFRVVVQVHCAAPGGGDL